jgi:hypothetical protein
MSVLKEAPHLVRAAGLVVALVAVLYFGRRALLPPSYAAHGTDYREAALQEMQTLPVVHQSVATCRSCHAAIADLHDKDVHQGVACTTCHGPGDKHVAFRRDGDKSITLAEARMPKEYTLEGCLYCHRRLAARPGDFPQQDPAEHYRQVHVFDPATKCIQCHSPHEPIYLSKDVKTARIHPVVYRCRDCHETKPTGDYHAVASHPVIFQCGDCHRAVVDDFAKKPHAKYVDCRTCHLFHRENESAGRIFPVGKVQFCLMCHGRAPFKAPDMPPKIDWPAHLKQVGPSYDPAKTVCITCHEDQIHALHLAVGPRAAL